MSMDRYITNEMRLWGRNGFILTWIYGKMEQGSRKKSWNRDHPAW